MIMKDLLSFTSISLSEPLIKNHSAQATVQLTHLDGKETSFSLQLSYETSLHETYLPLLRLAFCMPLLNYGLFSEKFELEFPLSTSDIHLLNHLNRVFSRDIYINKILRRRTNYILSEYLPDETSIKPDDSLPCAHIIPKNKRKDTSLSASTDMNKCGILSSGGKESLLSYGLLKELDASVYPLYVNESGGHWRTARTAYVYHKANDEHTMRVWTNVDRFYNFMLDNLPFIRKDHREIQADTYPIRLCIFPFYIFALLPLFINHHIGNLLIGSEFDDQRDRPVYKGIPHYYGVYDQHQDFDDVMNQWYTKRIPSMVQWSALRSISGLIVQRILVKRYPHLAQLQRSCHSCHSINDSIIPCGHCSKCLGVMLFLAANKLDPKMMNFQEKDIACFTKRLKTAKLRLDEDEKNHSLYLSDIHMDNQNPQATQHVEMIHGERVLCNPYKIPERFRSSLYQLLEKDTIGYCILQDNTWVSTTKEAVFSDEV